MTTATAYSLLAAVTTSAPGPMLPVHAMPWPQFAVASAACLTAFLSARRRGAPTWDGLVLMAGAFCLAWPDLFGPAWGRPVAPADRAAWTAAGAALCLAGAALAYGKVVWHARRGRL